MSDFELRRRLQDLKVERHPTRDLWPAIAAQLDAPAWRPARAPRRVMLPWAAVASVALAVVAGVWLAAHLGSMLASRHAGAEIVSSDSRPAMEAPMMLRNEARAMQASFDGAIAASGGSSARTPRSPELEAAARELDAATAQLEAALAQEPDATYLIELLKHTQDRRVALAKLGVRAT